MRFLLPLLAVVMLTTAAPAQRIFRSEVDKEQDAKIENLQQQMDAAKVLLRGSVDDSRRLDELTEDVAEIRSQLAATPTPKNSTQPPPPPMGKAIPAAACAQPAAACGGTEYATQGSAGCSQPSPAAAACGSATMPAMRQAAAGCASGASPGRWYPGKRLFGRR